jgi:hypothetical protein
MKKSSKSAKSTSPAKSALTSIAVVPSAAVGDKTRPVLVPAPLAGKEPTTPIAPGPFGFRPPKFPLNARITLLIAYNPKRPGTIAAAKFPLYNGVSTVSELIEAFRKAGYPKRRAYSALRFDSSRGFIKIES